MELLTINPAEVKVSANIRTAVELDKAFLDSIREHGVLQPPVVVRDESGQLSIRYGQRRHAAALEVGMTEMPVLIAGDLDEADRIVQQWIENEHRAKLGTGDRARAIQQLALLSVTPAKIAKKLGVKRAEVDQAMATVSSELATKAADRWQFLTLDQAAALAEFEDDADTVKALVVAAEESTGAFAHALQEARDDRALAEAVQARIDELTSEGVTVTDPPERGDSTAAYLHDLADGNGKGVSPQGHATCPGHAAYVQSRWGEIRTGYVCLDPAANGHSVRTSSNNARGPLTDQQKAERRELVANNKAWLSAEKVRRVWLTQLLTRKTPPKGAAQFIAGELTRGGVTLPRQYDAKDGAMLAELLGVKSSRDAIANGESATDGRAGVIALAVLIAGYERATHKSTWRNPGDDMRRYFTFLAALGYELADVEQLVIGKPKTSRKNQAA